MKLLWRKQKPPFCSSVAIGGCPKDLTGSHRRSRIATRSVEEKKKQVEMTIALTVERAKRKTAPVGFTVAFARCSFYLGSTTKKEFVKHISDVLFLAFSFSRWVSQYSFEKTYAGLRRQSCAVALLSLYLSPQLPFDTRSYTCCFVLTVSFSVFLFSFFLSFHHF